MEKESSIAVSRRGFLKGAAALGATATLYGCSKSDGGDNYIIGDDGLPEQPDPTADSFYFGTGNHNCGGRCLLTAHVKNGKITRLVANENPYDGLGNAHNPESANNAQIRACARCRGYKHRLYHPGRLKYPLKQTSKRGDLSGFVRISWEQALDEITRKHKAIREAYGPESIYSVYACGSYTARQGGNYSGLWTARNNSFATSTQLLGGFSPYYNNYSFHQQGFFSTTHTGYSGGTTNASSIAGVVNTVVLWGSNILSTVNPSANSTLLTLKAVRDRGGEIIFIGPEFSDQGVTCATKWIQTKPYTDGALILGMIHEMLINTFNTDGTLKPAAERWLNVDFLDAAVYGFFDSPEYWVRTSNPGAGTISFTDPGADYRKVNAVPAGKSLSAYIMGSDNRLTLADYADGKTYNAQQFSTVQAKRNVATCSYVAIKGDATQYQRKLDYNTIKDAKWASDITGVPEQTIKDLAKMYCTPAAHPIYSEWCGGFQKQAEGVINMFSLQTLGIVTQTYGRTGETIARGIAPLTTSAPASMPDISMNDISYNNTLSRWVGAVTSNQYIRYNQNNMPFPSCAMWHGGVRFAFGDVLKQNGYTAEYIPDLDPDDVGLGKAYHDDGGVKALIKWKRDANGLIETDANGYFVPDTSGGGVKYAGYRFIINAGGNILLNQHQNSNDSKDMFERIPIGTTNPDNGEDFCVVSFDNFLSPSPRWSDYVLPAATNWEMDNYQSITGGNSVITPAISQPPGESLSTWNFTMKYVEAAEKNGLSPTGASKDFTGVDLSAGATFYPNDQYIDKHRRAYQRSGVATNTSSRFYGKTFDEALKIQFATGRDNSSTVTTITSNATRTAIDNYLALSDAARQTTPLWPNISTSGQTGYGNQYPTTGIDPMPGQSGRFHVYSDLMVWQYENRFRAWHGYLPADERGQTNVDMEGDPIVYPIPMYFAYEDYFMEAYGGRDKIPADPFLLTTSHDRFRAHSSYSATPLLRELTHRTYKGKVYSGNDWGHYALSEIGENGEIPRLNKAIQNKDLKRASWSELWMNADDASERGINDGDLLLVENPVGAVRVIARLTDRCVRGFVGLHQGCWFDPDPVDGVDDGGNCNTLMATKPSRVDHGNGQQSAMVSIKKVNLNW